MSKEYRVGIVGCGGMGRSHAKAYDNNPATKVVAVADVHQESAEKLASEHSVSAVYTDYNQMFDKEDLDILSIPTWQGRRLWKGERTAVSRNSQRLRPTMDV